MRAYPEIFSRTVDQNRLFFLFLKFYFINFLFLQPDFLRSRLFEIFFFLFILTFPTRE